MRRGWSIIAGCFLAVALSIAPAYIMVFSLYLRPMAAEFGWTRTQLTLAPSVMALVSALLSPLAGVLIDRWGPRRVALIAVVLFPLALAGYAAVPASHGLYILLALFTGVAATICCPLTYVSILPQWFDRHLGLAISGAMTGIGFGQVIFPAVTARLITEVGWRGSWAITAAAVAVIGLLNVGFLFRENRRAVAPSEDTSVEPPAGQGVAAALATPSFWLLGVSVFLAAQVGQGVSLHLAALLADRGAAAAVAPAAITAIGFGSLTGRLLTGIMLDRLPLWLVGGAIFVGQAVGVGTLWSGGGTGPLLLAAAFLIGLGVGAETDIIPFALRRRFGRREFGRLFGILFGIFSLGPVVGPLLMSAAFDRLGSYQPALALLTGAALVAAVLMITAGAEITMYGREPQ